MIISLTLCYFVEYKNTYNYHKFSTRLVKNWNTGSVLGLNKNRFEKNGSKVSRLHIQSNALQTNKKVQIRHMKCSKMGAKLLLRLYNTVEGAALAQTNFLSYFGRFNLNTLPSSPNSELSENQSNPWIAIQSPISHKIFFHTKSCEIINIDQTIKTISTTIGIIHPRKAGDSHFPTHNEITSASSVVIDPQTPQHAAQPIRCALEPHTRTRGHAACYTQHRAEARGPESIWPRSDREPILSARVQYHRPLRNPCGFI